MLILAFESSGKAASVAICKDGLLLGQYYQNSGLTHSRTLLAMVESLLKNLEITSSDINLVAVSRGPGSFTGVRIGVSAAKGFAWGLDIPVCGVSTLEAMAYQIPGQNIIICPVMDARRNQVYNALFEWKEGSPVRLCEDRAISLMDLTVDLKKRNAPCLLLGDGAEISYKFLTEQSISCNQVSELLRFQTAYGVCIAAENSADAAVTASLLEPSYLRPSQAEQTIKN